MALIFSVSVTHSQHRSENIKRKISGKKIVSFKLSHVMKSFTHPTCVVHLGSSPINTVCPQHPTIAVTWAYWSHPHDTLIGGQNSLTRYHNAGVIHLPSF